jgi:Putative zinc-finger
VSDQDPALSTGHAVSLLLPWYLNGRLSPAERQEVDDHLRQCPECRDELKSLLRLAGEMKPSWESQPPPSSELRIRVLSQISKSPVASLADAQERRQLGRAPAQRRRSMAFPALAASLIVIQFAAILWMMRAPPTEVISRGIASGGTRIKIVFQPTAREADIRDALSNIHARIVDGPDAGAAYMLQLLNESPADTARELAALGRRKELVQHIELAAP